MQFWRPVSLSTSDSLQYWYMHKVASLKTSHKQQFDLSWWDLFSTRESAEIEVAPKRVVLMLLWIIAVSHLLYTSSARFQLPKSVCDLCIFFLFNVGFLICFCYSFYDAKSDNKCSQRMHRFNAKAQYTVHAQSASTKQCLWCEAEAHSHKGMELPVLDFSSRSVGSNSWVSPHWTWPSVQPACFKCS